MDLVKVQGLFKTFLSLSSMSLAGVAGSPAQWLPGRDQCIMSGTCSMSFMTSWCGSSYSSRVADKLCSVECHVTDTCSVPIMNLAGMAGSYSSTEAPKLLSV